MSAVAHVLLLGPARQAAGTATIEVDAATVDAVCRELTTRFGPDFAAVLNTSRIWVDGRPVTGDDPVPSRAEVSILPPVSGG